MKILASCIVLMLFHLIINLFQIDGLYAADSDSVRAMFANPPRQYSTAPLWVWNDMLTEKQIVSTMTDLASQKVKQVFVHPRPGLMTPYLSEDWFRLWKVALREAERLDMNVWIYDENSYPSGFAGGFVPDAMPESQGRGLILTEQNETPSNFDHIIAVYRINKDGYENITNLLRSDQKFSKGRYVVASVNRAGNSPWYGGKCYVDLLYPGVTDKFIDITLEPYRENVGDQFGRRIPGSFTDEPHLLPAGGLPWTKDLAERFLDRWGYSLIDNLPSLTLSVGEWKRVRHNYYQLLLELFIERWATPIYEYCQKNGLEFTGHYWEHEWPKCTFVPDNMAMYAWHQRPAIDTLMNQYREDTHAQFGNVRTVLELASVANQMGYSRTLCEAYGAGGWDLRFEDMKRIGDWLYVLGVNTLNEHLSYITIRGARKRDHPQSFSYHEPWWDAYHIMASYFSRLSLALSHGQQVNNILLLEPTTTAWIYQSDSAHLNEMGNQFQQMVVRLAKAQVEFDIGSEDIIARNGSVVTSQFKVGRCLYDTIVIPPLTENLNTKTVELLESYLTDGGIVYCCGTPPALIDGAPSNNLELIWQNNNFKIIDTDTITKILQDRSSDSFCIRSNQDDPGILFHQRRQFEDGELLFLVNTSIDSFAKGIIESSAQSIQEWNREDGSISEYYYQSVESGIETDFSLPPCGSLLLFLSKKSSTSVPRETVKSAAIAPMERTSIRRLKPNVLTLDYVDITAGGETKKNMYFYQANQYAFQKNGLSRNPWDSSVQFRDELIKIEFPPDSGFEAMYCFSIEEKIPQPLTIVIERPALYQITCNGKTVSAAPGAWWLDKSFGKIDITSAARIGRNTVNIKASPMTINHELEPAYLLGNFSLKSGTSGFVVVPDRTLKMELGKTHSDLPDGSMWLSTGIAFGTNSPGDQEDDGEPFLVFDLGNSYDLNAIKIWNYNERNLTGRGVKNLKITASGSTHPELFEMELGTFELKEAWGNNVTLANSMDFPETFRVDIQDIRFVKFEILSNHNDATFPADDPGKDFALVGLSEVQFFTKLNDKTLKLIPNVTITEFSSELTNGFNRQARYLVDNNDFQLQGIGWNLQGHPFYAADVSYMQKFNVSQIEGRFCVQLSKWYGSVARVNVNEEIVGYIYSQPWQCDITEWIKKGVNTIDIEVVGTLKNTLGPHHGNPPLGLAWPGMFHNGPVTGPPPGNQYHTVGYGLFEPFKLVQFLP